MTTPEAEIPEPLRELLKSCFNVELFWDYFPQTLGETLAFLGPEKAALFKQQFAHAIARETISLDQYRKLTNQGFKTEVELNFWLRDRWVDIYDDDPIPGDDE